MTGSSTVINHVPVLGLYSTPSDEGGHVVVYGDSNCIDSAHIQRDCFWLLETLLKYATSSNSQPPFTGSKQVRTQPTALPQRMEGKSLISITLPHDVMYYCTGNRLHHYSRVLDPSSHKHFRSLPSCPQLKWALPHPLNSSASGNIFRPKNPLSAYDGGHDPMDLVAVFDEDIDEGSRNILAFGGIGVGVIVLWLVCRRQRRRSIGRRGTILSKLPVV